VSHKTVIKKELQAIYYGVPVVGLISTYFSGGFAPNELQPVYAIVSFVISTIFTVTFWLGNYSIFNFCRNWLPAYQQTLKRILAQIVLCTIYSAMTSALLTYLINLSIPESEENYWHNFLYGYAMTLLISTIYEAAYFFGKRKETIIESEKLQKENLRTQYEMLKTQVNPHFLFNILNVLASLVHMDAYKAEAFVKEFSQTYRYLLDVKDKTLVSLREELSFMKSYLFLQQIRFEEGLDCVIDIDEAFLDDLLPPVDLQMLIENAIKHNIISKSKPLIIDIYEEDSYIVIKNNLQKRTHVESTGIGLENLEEKYKLLADFNPAFAEKENYFIAKLPLIKPE